MSRVFVVSPQRSHLAPCTPARAKAPLTDAAAVNATRWTLYHRLEAFGVATETGSGGRTQYNRIQRGLPKAHWVDAACGFPDKAPKATSVVGGYRSGDLVRAVVPGSSKKAGSYVGRIAVRATGSCNIQTSSGTIQGIHYRYCRSLHRADGYTYAKGERAFLPTP